MSYQSDHPMLREIPGFDYMADNVAANAPLAIGNVGAATQQKHYRMLSTLMGFCTQEDLGLATIREQKLAAEHNGAQGPGAPDWAHALVQQMNQMNQANQLTRRTQMIQHEQIQQQFQHMNRQMNQANQANQLTQMIQHEQIQQQFQQFQQQIQEVNDNMILRFDEVNNDMILRFDEVNNNMILRFDQAADNFARSMNSSVSVSEHLLQPLRGGAANVLPGGHDNWFPRTLRELNCCPNDHARQLLEFYHIELPPEDATPFALIQALKDHLGVRC